MSRSVQCDFCTYMLNLIRCFALQMRFIREYWNAYLQRLGMHGATGLSQSLLPLVWNNIFLVLQHEVCQSIHHEVVAFKTHVRWRWDCWSCLTIFSTYMCNLDCNIALQNLDCKAHLHRLNMGRCTSCSQSFLLLILRNRYWMIHQKLFSCFRIILLHSTTMWDGIEMQKFFSYDFITDLWQFGLYYSLQTHFKWWLLQSIHALYCMERGRCLPQCLGAMILYHTHFTHILLKLQVGF